DANVSGAMMGMSLVERRMATLGNSAGGLSGKMARLGGTLTGIGLGMATLGAAGIAVMVKATNTAMEYDRQSALTLTQIQQKGVTVNQVAQAGLNVITSVPAAYASVQASMYNLFSSMNISLTDGAKLETQFAKAAVAGQVDIATASKATIGEMNAFKIPITDVTKVLDEQFKMVSIGRGNYADFITAIGTASPQAAAAGQSIATMSGSLAFMTRDGLSASTASSAIARTLQKMITPAVLTNLDALGIKTKDAHGNLLQINDIFTQLAINKGWANLTGPELAANMQKLFGGASTANVRQFFNLAIKNSGALNDSVNQVNNSTGS